MLNDDDSTRRQGQNSVIQPPAPATTTSLLSWNTHHGPVTLEKIAPTKLPYISIVAKVGGNPGCIRHHSLSKFACGEHGVAGCFATSSCYNTEIPNDAKQKYVSALDQESFC